MSKDVRFELLFSLDVWSRNCAACNYPGQRLRLADLLCEPNNFHEGLEVCGQCQNEKCIRARAEGRLTVAAIEEFVVNDRWSQWVGTSNVLQCVERVLWRCNICQTYDRATASGVLKNGK